MSEPDAAIRPMRRVMVLQRDLNDKPVPPHRKAAPTARAVARAEAALRAHGVEPVGPGGDDGVDFVLVLGGDGTISHRVFRRFRLPLRPCNRSSRFPRRYRRLF